MSIDSDLSRIADALETIASIMARGSVDAEDRAVAAAAPAPEPTPEPEPEPKKLAYEDLAEVALKIAKSGDAKRKQALTDLIKGAGCKSLRSLDETRYMEVYTSLLDIAA